MRYFTIFFALYILVLASMPCSDLHNECNSTKNTQSGLVQNDNHNHKSDHNDFCSPFCICSCCHSIISLISTNTSLNIIAINSIERNIKESIQNFMLISRFLGSIWQPP